MRDRLISTGTGRHRDGARGPHPAVATSFSFNTLPGLAREVVALAETIGVKLTPAGATYPYGKDPKDCNIRLSPTYPSLDDVQAAITAFIVCVKIASLNARLNP